MDKKETIDAYIRAVAESKARLTNHGKHGRFGDVSSMDHSHPFGPVPPGISSRRVTRTPEALPVAGSSEPLPVAGSMNAPGSTNAVSGSRRVTRSSEALPVAGSGEPPVAGSSEPLPAAGSMNTSTKVVSVSTNPTEATNTQHGFAIYKQMIDFVVPEYESLRDDCNKLRFDIKTIQAQAVDVMNKMSHNEESMEPIEAFELDSRLNRIYLPSSFSSCAIPPFTTKDAAFWTKMGNFTDEVRRQSASLQPKRIQLRAERSRARKALREMLDSYDKCVELEREFSAAKTRLKQAWSGAMSTFNITMAMPPSIAD